MRLTRGPREAVIGRCLGADDDVAIGGQGRKNSLQLGALLEMSLPAAPLGPLVGQISELRLDGQTLFRRECRHGILRIVPGYGTSQGPTRASVASFVPPRQSRLTRTGWYPTDRHSLGVPLRDRSRLEATLNGRGLKRSRPRFLVDPAFSFSPPPANMSSSRKVAALGG